MIVSFQRAFYKNEENLVGRIYDLLNDGEEIVVSDGADRVVMISCADFENIICINRGKVFVSPLDSNGIADCLDYVESEIAKIETVELRLEVR